MPLDLCTISGIVYDVAGQPKSGVAISVMKTLKDGVIINERPQQASLNGEAVLSAADGTIQFTVPRGSTVYLYGGFFINGNDFTSAPNTGLAVSIPDSATASLEDLAIAIVDDTIFVDTDNTLAANSDQRVASQKAIKAYVDAIPGVGSTVSEAELVLSDNTTANASTTKHGLMPKGDGNAAHVFRGDLSQSAVTKSEVGLSNVDNVSDANKPVSIAQAAADSTVASAAATDATTKANTAQANAISTASADATSKANTAQANAISAAASDATAKANAAQAAAIAAIPTPNITIPMILASVEVDLNEGTGAKQALYTCPASRRAVITNIVMQKFSGNPAAAVAAIGWNAGADNVVGGVNFTAVALTATESVNLATPDTGAGTQLMFAEPTIGIAADILGIKVITPEGSALTVRVDVVGYWTDTSGVPVANVVGVAP